MKPCIECGEPTAESRCEEHRRESWQHREASARERGYDRTWDKLSIRARRLQPWCSDCYSTEDLTTDHSERAWKRKAEGKAIRLRDVAVLCGRCNIARGSSRTLGRGGDEQSAGPARQAKSPLHTPSEGRESAFLVGACSVSDLDREPATLGQDDRVSLVGFDRQDTGVSNAEGPLVVRDPAIARCDGELHIRILP